MKEFTVEKSMLEQTLLHELTSKKTTRRIVAQIYRLALDSNQDVDWKKVNQAIINRWSVSALDWIKNQAWSGKCFA